MNFYNIFNTMAHFLQTQVTFNPVGIFDNVYYLLMQHFLQPFSNTFVNVIDSVGPIIYFCWFLFILSYGYMILAGKIQAPAKDLVFRMMIATVIFSVALNSARYKEWIINPVMNLTNITAATLIPESSSQSAGSLLHGLIGDTPRTNNTNKGIYNANAGLFAGLDVSLEAVGIIISSVIDTYQSTVSLSSDITATVSEKEAEKIAKSAPAPVMSIMLVMGFIGLLVTGAVMIYVTAAIILMINHMLLVILLVVGPLFLVLAIFKPTREYTKKWASRLVAVILTIGITTAVITFILGIQGKLSGQICKTTAGIQRQMIFEHNKKMESFRNNTKYEDSLLNVTDVAWKTQKALLALHLRAGRSSGDFFKAQALAFDIQEGCGIENLLSATATPSGGEEYNILFSAIQFLVVCMMLNRVLTESANLAAGLVNASGINAGTGQEVSGSVQGISSRYSGYPGR